MRTFPTLFALLLAISTSAVARIGETPKECEKRYGPRASSSDEGDLFEKGEFVILITFFEGKADRIAYGKKKDKRGQHGEFSDNEIEQLLKANSGGREWKKTPTSPRSQWLTVDEELIAGYGGPPYSLVIFTKAYSKRSSAESKEKEIKNLEGF